MFMYKGSMYKNGDPIAILFINYYGVSNLGLVSFAQI